jgi:carbon-monoxide dehydrogenase medium subunit
VKIYGPQGDREVLLEDFFTGPGQTVLAGDELLVEINVPSPSPRTGKVYLKHGRRKAMELATVGVAAAMTLDGDGDECQQVRIVLGAVAPTPIRARGAEAMLQGIVPDDKAITAVAEAAMAEARPISDVRSSADYRREMVRVLTARAVKQALNLAEVA